MLEKVLVPLDGSEPGESALAYAEDLAARLHSELCLLHVYESRETEHSRLFETYLDSLASREITALRARMKDDVPRVTFAAIEGTAASAIVDYAETGNFSLIALASHGASGVMPWALGGVATKVAHDLRVPVLLVRSAAIAGGDDPLARIAVPLDGSEAGEAAVPYIRALAASANTEVTLLQVMSSSERVRTLGGVDYFRLPESIADRMQVEAEEYLKKVEAGFAGTHAVVKREIRSGNPAQEIIKLCDETTCGLVALSSHGHSGIERWVLGSVSDKVLHSARIATLLVRAGPRT